MDRQNLVIEVKNKFFSIIYYSKYEITAHNYVANNRGYTKNGSIFLIDTNKLYYSSIL